MKLTAEENDMKHRLVPRYIEEKDFTTEQLETAFDAIFNHHITRAHSMTGRECKDLARAVLRAQKKAA